MIPQIPDFGIDLTGLLNNGVALLGGVFGAAIAIYFGFLIIRAGVRFAGRGMSGRSV